MTLVTADVPLRCMPTTMTPLVIAGRSLSAAGGAIALGQSLIAGRCPAAWPRRARDQLAAV